MERFPFWVRVYITAVTVAGALALWMFLPRGNPLGWMGTAIVLVVAGAVVSQRPLPTANPHSRVDLTGAIHIMAFMLLPIGPAAWVAACISLFAGLLLRRPHWNTAFLAATHVLSVAAAGAVYHSFVSIGARPLTSLSSGLGLALALLAYWTISSVLITILGGHRTRAAFTRSFIVGWRELLFPGVALMALGILGAIVWREEPYYLLLLLIPAVGAHMALNAARVKQEQVIQAMYTIADLLDRRDPFRFQHSQRVAAHAERLARALHLPEWQVERIRQATRIHDIGKLGVSEKNVRMGGHGGNPTSYQFYNLRLHTQLGAYIARQIPAFEDCEAAIRYHHDWYDGSHASTPHRGEQIPLEARVIAVVNTYDELCMENGEVCESTDLRAIQKLQEMRGKQLDAHLVDAFVMTLSRDVGGRIAGLVA